MSNNINQQTADWLSPSGITSDSSLVEKVIATEQPWQGRIFGVEVSEVALPDGTRGRREIARHHGGAGVCVVCKGSICLIRQWRIAVGRLTWEIPAGKLDPGENPAACAVRELKEETGLVARTLEPLATSYGSVGFSDECTYIFLARDVSVGRAHPDRGELVDFRWVPLDVVLAGVRQGKICDSKTIIAATMAHEVLASSEDL